MSCGLKVSINPPKMRVSIGNVEIRRNAQIFNDVGRVSSSTYTRVPNISLTVEKSGTYNVYWSGYRNSTSGVFGTQLCINGVDYGTAKTSFDETYDSVQNVCLENVRLNQGDVLTIKARSRTTSYAMSVMGLTIIET